MPVAQPVMPQVHTEADAYAVAKGADALIIVTEWNEFRELELVRIKSDAALVIVDGRNIYVPDYLDALGFVYNGVGRREWSSPERPGSSPYTSRRRASSTAWPAPSPGSGRRSPPPPPEAAPTVCVGTVTSPL